jgi:hypothetical protein
MRCSYHIYGETGHKIIDCLKFNDMHNMFKNKGVNTTNKPSLVEPSIQSFSSCNGCQRGHHQEQNY